MTVNELIEFLKTYPEELEVEILDGRSSVQIRRLFLDTEIIDLGPGVYFKRLSVDREVVVIVPEGDDAPELHYQENEAAKRHRDRPHED